MNSTADICWSVCPDARLLSKSNITAMAVCILTLIPITTVSNVTVLVALVRTKSIGRESQLFPVALCVTDILIGTLLQPLSAAYLLSGTLQDACATRWAIQALSYSLLCLDFFIISSMGLERLLALKFSLSDIFLRWLAVKKYVLAVDVTFAVAMAAASVLIAQQHNNNYHVFNLSLQAIGLVLAIVTTVAYKLACNHVRKAVMLLSNAAHSSIHVPSRKLRHDIALARSVAVILCLGLALYLPYGVSGILWTLSYSGLALTNSTEVIQSIFLWCILLVYLNSSLNVFVYSYHNRPVRKYISEKLSFIFRS